MQRSSASLVVRQLVDYTLTTSWTNIVGLILPPVEKTGLYQVLTMINAYVATAGDAIDVRVAVNGERIIGDIEYYLTGHVMIAPGVMLEDTISLKVGDIVSVQGIFGAGASVIRMPGIVGGGGKNFLQITKVGE